MKLRVSLRLRLWWIQALSQLALRRGFFLAGNNLYLLGHEVNYFLDFFLGQV
jgi:hypothetical protein